MHAWKEGAGEAELVEAEEAVGEDDGGCGGGVVGAEGGVGVGYEGAERGETGIGCGSEGSAEIMVDERRCLNERS